MIDCDMPENKFGTSMASFIQAETTDGIINSIHNKIAKRKSAVVLILKKYSNAV